MSTETEFKTYVQPKVEMKPSLFAKLSPHLELIAAGISGILIVIGWILHHFDYSSISIAAYLLAFVIGGYAKAKEGITETIDNKELNVEMLMIFAAIGSAIIGYWAEGAILIFIFAVSGALETYTMNKSNKEISALMKLQPEEAIKILPDGREQAVPVSSLTISDIILIKPGERVPVDGKIIKGTTAIDEAAITGESIPLTKEINDEVFAGTVNISGSITVTLTKHADETLFQKIITLIQSAQSEKSPSQAFIEKFEGSYVKIVLSIVGLLLILPHFLLGWSWNETFYRAMIFLVVASPCALVASIMPATLSAISNGARAGILFKGGVHLENLAHVSAIAFDKTGTLTKGKPVVTDVFIDNKFTEKEIVQLTASIESHSNHPLAKAIVRYAEQKYNEPLTQPESIQDNSGWGVTAKINNTEWRIGKAAFVGEKEAIAFQNKIYEQISNEGKTAVFVKKDTEIIALIALKDVVREESKEAIDRLKQNGIYTVMITGDSEKTANAISKESHVDEYIAECLPEKKVASVKELKEKYGIVAMVGDGINDAPALATANVGIAMGEGTDVALETADVVLMKNDLPRIAEAIQLSKRMNRIIKQNIIFSISVIMLLIISNFLQAVALPFGVIGHEGSTILVILNSLRLLKS
ncbi:cadmium-translocating P-type ATPase [Cytobacillus oceanisediminis]|uniref:heavy metal translocating P-type ATPase n=1 Tax=Bacillaceae TaxID=186817 RepID=UPI002665C77B|nr:MULTISPECIES: heavy metal translocating P-type ATPase [Bacillaceae]MBZ9535016.1 cadmium-translocating P-type ATPase [Cytobacillus oceanisediminis]